MLHSSSRFEHGRGLIAAKPQPSLNLYPLYNIVDSSLLSEKQEIDIRMENLLDQKKDTVNLPETH